MSASKAEMFCWLVNSGFVDISVGLKKGLLPAKSSGIKQSHATNITQVKRTTCNQHK